MISPDALLYIYEIRGDSGVGPSAPPRSFIGLWNEEGFLYLFFTRSEDAYVQEIACGLVSVPVSRNVMSYRDWQAGLPRAGLTIGGVHFVPDDHSAPPSGSVLLDPSVVFGDGTHLTTVCCLRNMQRIFRSCSIASLLDLGTGSGILALAAARMGVRHVLAVDRNRLAVRTAERNVLRNSLTHAITVQEGEARLFIDRPFDMVAANLPFQVLRDLCALPGMSRHRFWIVSGINQAQAVTIADLFLERGFEVLRQWNSPPWVTISLTRNNAVSVSQLES